MIILKKHLLVIDEHVKLKKVLGRSESHLGMVFLIVESHPAHKAKMVMPFIESVKDRQLFFLPPYSPELNPDERVWNILKNNAFGRKFIDWPKELKKDVISDLRLVQKSPDRVRSYFQN